MLLTNEQRKLLSQPYANSGKWIVRNNVSLKDIEVCEGEATYDPLTRTCKLCVAANRTAYSAEVCAYEHPHCKCTYKNNSVTVKVDFPMQKLTNYLFTNENKSAMMRRIGYTVEDSDTLRQTLSAVIKKQYEEGNYTIGVLDNHGVRIQINTVFIGKRDHA